MRPASAAKGGSILNVTDRSHVGRILVKPTRVRLTETADLDRRELRWVEKRRYRQRVLVLGK